MKWRPGGGRRHRALVPGEDGLVVGPVALVVVAPGGDVGRQRHMADRRDRLVEIGPARSKRRRTSPPSPFSSTVASRPARRQARSGVRAEADAVAGWRCACPAARRRASDRVATRRCSVASTAAPVAAGTMALASSRAGITFVSLRTSASPGRRRSGEIADMAVARARSPWTTSRRALSRGSAGRRAIRSSGRSKSNASTRIEGEEAASGVARRSLIVRPRRRGRAS